MAQRFNTYWIKDIHPNTVRTEHGRAFFLKFWICSVTICLLNVMCFWEIKFKTKCDCHCALIMGKVLVEWPLFSEILTSTFCQPFQNLCYRKETDIRQNELCYLICICSCQGRGILELASQAKRWVPTSSFLCAALPPSPYLYTSFPFHKDFFYKQ